MSAFKIDLKSLKDKHNKKSDSSNKEKEDTLNAVAINEEEKNTKDISVEKGKTKSPVKSTKINLGGIKSLDNTKEKINSEEKKEKIKKENEEKLKEKKLKDEKEDIDNKEVFEKYKSEFEKNKTSILERIKKLKLIPKTRVGFLIFISITSIIGILSLFIFVPEKHSVEIYKNTILNVLNIKSSNNNTGLNTNKIKENIKVEDQNIAKQESNSGKTNKPTNNINIGGFDINYQKQIIDGKELIIYDSKTYNSEKELQEDMINIINKIKKNKLSEFFKK